MNRLDEIDFALKSNVIDKDALARWKDNVVTKRFLLEIEKDLLETREAAIGLSGFDCQKIALRSVQKDAHCEVLEMVLQWNPTKEDSVDE